MIYIENKRKSNKSILKKYPNAKIIDITSKGCQPWVRLSPFYSHGGIPIPYSPNCFANSVEGIWQGLKVFNNEGIDISKFNVSDMKGLKRTIRKYGIVKGHQKGINSLELLDYLTARKEIYLKTYKWVLDNKVQDVITLLRDETKKQDIVLLDYNVNQENVYTSMKPLSHAFLVKLYLEKQFTTINQSIETNVFNTQCIQNVNIKNNNKFIDKNIIKLYTINGYSLTKIHKECSMSVDKIKKILIFNNVNISRSKRKRGTTLF
ncbi:MAG: hypothetical protein LBR28_00580 [Bacteroidales bacterium]|jgi:hypothetical protein|nr:hypothetical protein [Bacteroidales bacterium]